MSFDELSRLYQPLPRSTDLGRSVLESAVKARNGVLGTLAVSFLLGIPLSFVSFRRSRPWEPLHIVWGGLSIAIFAVPIALVIFFVIRAYVKIFREGRVVEGTIVENRGGGSLVQSVVGVGPDLSFVPNLRRPIGERVPMLLSNDPTSSKALCVTGPGSLTRCSLLTRQQLAQVPGA